MKPSFEEKYRLLYERYEEKKDPWGLDILACKKALKTLWPLYDKYFDVELYNQHHIQDKSYIVTSNHSGQIPIDAMLVGIAFAMETDNPRILRAMVERFLAKLPFLGELSAKLGAILGDRQNANYLLEHGESLLVFPEGVRGISKGTKDFYKLQTFPSGFVKIAAQTQTPILPIAVVGAEEFYPYVYNLKPLARLLNLPALPITPLFPFFGPLGAIPFPSPVDIYVGEEIAPPKSMNFDEIQEVKNKVEDKIQEMINHGLEKRRPLKQNILNLVEQFQDTDE